MARPLFVTPDDIKRFTAANGNIDEDKIIKFITIAQDTHLQNTLGYVLFNKISNDIINDELQDPYLSLVNNYIKPMLLHWAFVEYLPFGAYIVGNKGIFKHTAENAQNADKNEVDFLMNKEADTAKFYTRRLMDYICANNTQFPEYNEFINGHLSSSKTSQYGGWYLP